MRLALQMIAISIDCSVCSAQQKALDKTLHYWSVQSVSNTKSVSKSVVVMIFKFMSTETQEKKSLYTMTS